jgi:hypothetical protein
MQLFKIGKELGLTRKEIKSVLFFEKRYPLVLAIVLIIVLTVFAFFFWNVALSLYIQSTEPVYPRGTLYSSISPKDFKDKK